MSRDPFDEMKRNNPVPGEDLPGAPASVADRIIAGSVRRPWPAWATAVAAAVSVAVVGFGLLWFFDEPAPRGVADGGVTTTAQATTTSNAVATTTSLADLDEATTVYFFVDTTGESWPGGPFLMPVARMVDGPDELTGTLQALLDGPTADEASSVPAISSAVPPGTTINEVTVADGIATVDLSAEFGSGGGTLSMMGRLGQVVFTLTRLDGIDGVRFEIEGVATTVFGGEGIIVPDPATRADFEGLLPAILIESPTYGDFGTANPLIARGSANVFEATVSLALVDGDGLIIWEGFTTATCGTGCRGEWEVTIPYEVDAPQMGSLIVWESSARDGSQTNIREHPVWLLPANPETTTTLPDGTCSGFRASTELVDQPGLPAIIAAKREAIFAAAVSCDWPTLASLLGPGFSYTFGIDTDPIAYWQEREAAGEPVLYFLAELLNRPFGVQTAGDVTYYAWPSAFVTEWSAVPEADRQALLPLYDDADLDTFAEFGSYYGYRIGIIDDGTWVYFIAGD
ncbi:MAG: GerMN domain-containing protein [Acidimicrobiia bacterium]|nr:GerMN domain-containing protein [Acidimicrobiia bacterium]